MTCIRMPASPASPASLLNPLNPLDPLDPVSPGAPDASVHRNPVARWRPSPRRVAAGAAFVLVAAMLAGPIAGRAHAAARVGVDAPPVTLSDTSGKAVSLADFRGRHVVLEWVNPGCPFVQKHYDSKNMQGLQARYGAKGVVWLAVHSTHPPHQDHLAPDAMARQMKAWGGAPTATLMDPDGVAGRAYGARTTPHMFVIDPDGKVVYAGGIDDRRTANPADVPKARNHVAAAIDEALAGKPVSVATSAPYGCSVKY